MCIYTCMRVNFVFMYCIYIATIRTCTFVHMYVLRMSIMCVYYTCVISYIGALLSVTDNDDDYCISCAVTIVDVRSCTRPPRLLDQQHISENPLISIPPRLLDHTIISKSTDDSRPQLSNVIGTYVRTCIW